jgi:hypothetical protein
VERIAGGAEASSTSCANHAANLAVANCERCGVFMCSLCRIAVDETQLCPTCFDRLTAEGALPSTRTRYRDYGRQASSYALLGVLLWVIGPLLGPLAVYYGFRSLRQLREMDEPGGRVRAWLSVLAGAAQAVGGVWLWVVMLEQTV